MPYTNMSVEDQRWSSTFPLACSGELKAATLCRSSRLCVELKIHSEGELFYLLGDARLVDSSFDARAFAGCCLGLRFCKNLAYALDRPVAGTTCQRQEPLLTGPGIKKPFGRLKKQKLQLSSK